jgi:hypothetical protein
MNGQANMERPIEAIRLLTMNSLGRQSAFEHNRAIAEAAENVAELVRGRGKGPFSGSFASKTVQPTAGCVVVMNLSQTMPSSLPARHLTGTLTRH